MSKSNRLTVKEYDEFVASVGYDKIKEILQSHTNVLDDCENDHCELGYAYNQFVYDKVDNDICKSLTTIGLAAASVHFADDEEKAVVPIALKFIDTVFTKYHQFVRQHIWVCYDKRRVYGSAFNAITELEAINWIDKLTQILEDNSIPISVKEKIIDSTGITMIKFISGDAEFRNFINSGDSNIPLALLLSNHIGALHDAENAYFGLMRISERMNVYLTQHPRGNTLHYATEVSLKGEGLLLAFGVYMEYRMDIMKYKSISESWYIKHRS